MCVHVTTNLFIVGSAWGGNRVDECGDVANEHGVERRPYEHADYR